MTIPDQTDELLRLMLERRAGAPMPGSLFLGVADAVRMTAQVAGAPARSVPVPPPRGRRPMIAAAGLIVVVAVLAVAALAGGVFRGAPTASLPGVGLVPSSSAASSPDASLAALQPLPSGTQASPGAVQVDSRAWKLKPGWQYDLECYEDEGGECHLHLYDDAAREQDGWPVSIPGACSDPVAVGPRESVFVACTRNGRAVVTGLDRSGKAIPGWPVRIRGSVAWSRWNAFGYGASAPAIAVGSDATVYVAVATGDQDIYSVHALTPDAKPRKGWPVTLPGGGQGFSLGLGGAIAAWWYEGIAREEYFFDARRTRFTMIGPNGKTLPGWPIGSKGAASGPVVGTNGLFYVSATGKVWGHDRTGKVLKGWPYDLQAAIAPELRSDGTLMFIDDSEVVVLDQRGRPVPGWPYEAHGTFGGPGCDTPGSPYQPKAVTADGRLYLSEWDGRRASIIALDGAGRSANGFPYRVADGWRVTSLESVGGGLLEARLTGDACGYGRDDTSIRIGAAGTLVGDAPWTPLSVVYKSLRLAPLHGPTTSTFRQGVSIDLQSELVNRSSSSVTLPRVDVDGDAFYAAGQVQTWLERLGTYAVIDCLPFAERKNRTWYAVGASLIVAAKPEVVEPRWEDGRVDPGRPSLRSDPLPGAGRLPAPRRIRPARRRRGFRHRRRRLRLHRDRRPDADGHPGPDPDPDPQADPDADLAAETDAAGIVRGNAGSVVSRSPGESGRQGDLRGMEQV